MAFTGPSSSPPSGDPAFWRKSNNDVYYNVSNGNVGIATTTPSYKLDVNGTFRAATSTFNGTVESTSGGFKFPDGTTQTTAIKPFKGALVYHSTNQTITAGTAYTAMWDSETYDTDSIHAPGDNTKLTVPTGVTKVKLKANVASDGNANGFDVAIYKNNLAVYGLPYEMLYVSGAPRGQNLASAVVNVNAGDYFTVVLSSQTNSNILRTTYTPLYVQALSWFAMEIVE